MHHALGLRELLNEDHEIAGCVEYPIDRKHQFGGTTSNVDIPNCKFTYHTHPKVAYVENGVEMAWPSGEDIGAMVSSPNCFGHAIISVEGVYVMSLAPNVKAKLLSMKPAQREDVADIVQSIFKSTHDFRSKTLMKPDDFVKWANGFTFSVVDGQTSSTLGPCTMKSCPSRNVPTPYKDETWPIDKWMRSQGIPPRKFEKVVKVIGRHEPILKMRFIPWSKFKHTAQ